MSYFEDASLVMIPSGIKDQKVYSIKPTDGSGDLTFSRASNATRVNSSGLVEKVRTNVILDSELQTAGVYQISSGIDSVTAVSNPITGQNNAFKITTNTTDDPYFFQNITGLTNGENTISYWLWTDSGQSTEATMFFYNAGASEIYTQEVTLTTTPTRYSFTVNFTNIGALATVRLDLRQVGPSIQYVYTYGWQAESGVMTDYIATTSTAVSVGPVSGLPRLDYTPTLGQSGGGGASCPSLLLEPQRTNLVTFSEQFDNAAWTKGNSSITANTATSPDGYTNADKLVEDTTNNAHYVLQSVTNTSGQQYAVSVYAKSAGRDWLVIYIGGGPAQGRFFNLSNGTLGSVLANTPNDSSITSMGNGWYRCSIVYTATDAASDLTIMPAISNGTNTYTGDGTSGVLIYGAQAELGAYPSSYVNTLSSAVTRVADAASKTGISSLIGSTEGVLYAEVDVKLLQQAGRILLDVNDNDTNNRVLLLLSGSSVEGFVQGSTRVGYTLPSAGIYKFAFAYKSGDFALYVNGVLQSVSTDAVTFSGMNQLFLGHTFNINNTQPVDGIKSALLFTQRLPNSDLATLTA